MQKNSEVMILTKNKWFFPLDFFRGRIFSDVYFNRMVDILKKDDLQKTVTYQIFVREEAMISGISMVIDILKKTTGFYKDDEQAYAITKKLLNAERDLSYSDFQETKKLLSYISDYKMKLRELWVDKSSEIEVKAISDGSFAFPYSAIMTITGNPIYFSYLETVILGIIARGTSVATNIWKVKKLTEKSVLYFGSRFDQSYNQFLDGYSALIAGADGVSTFANSYYMDEIPLGTIPHAMIAVYDGNTSNSVIAFDKYTDEKVNRIALVDWDNDCIGTTKKLIKDFYEYVTGGDYTENNTDISSIIGIGKNKLWGVRFDTSSNLRDISVTPIGDASLGVCPELVFKARKEFDKIGADNLKIIVSGGFNERKIDLFEKLNVPVDGYGIGSSILKKKLEATADIVFVDGKPCSKKGRTYWDNPNLKLINLED